MADGAGTVANVTAAGESAAAVAVASGAPRRLLVASGVDLIEAAPWTTTDSQRISLEAYGVPVAVAAGGGARYVAARDDAGRAYRIVKIEDGAARAAR